MLLSEACLYLNYILKLRYCTRCIIPGVSERDSLQKHKSQTLQMSQGRTQSYVYNIQEKGLRQQLYRLP